MGEADQDVELIVTEASEREVAAAALDAILAATRPRGAGADAEAGTTAAAIRGQGSDLGAVLFALANDLLAQLDANGGGLNAVRLDGLLRTEDGYTAWGYAFGEPAADGPPIDVTLAGEPVVERADGTITVRIPLRRG